MKRHTLPKPNVRQALMFVAVLILGLVGLLGYDPNGQTVGSLFVVVGIGGLLWWKRRFWQWRRAQQAAEAEAQRRAELQTVRRERGVQEREKRQAEQETQSNAAAKLRDIRETERRAEVEIAEMEARRRLDKEHKIEAEAERLRLLAFTSFISEVAALFTARGYQVETASASDPGALLLNRTDSRSLDIVRCLPAAHSATASDGYALEAWRMEAGAEHAYLISVRGFEKDLVRLARERPLTLIEPLLLATWKQN